MLDPIPRRCAVCLHLFLPRRHRPSPRKNVGRLPASYLRNNDFSQDTFRGCRYFIMFRPPSLLAPRIVPTAATPTAGQLGLLHPGTPCFVASARSGYANRPTSGNWRYGDLHPARLSALSAAPATMPRFQSPPRRTQHAGFPHYAHLFASHQGLWDLSCWGDFRLWSSNPIAVEQLQVLVEALPTPPRPTEAL